MQAREEYDDDPNLLNNVGAAAPYMPDFVVRISISILDFFSAKLQALRDYDAQITLNNRFTDAAGLTRDEVDGAFLLADYHEEAVEIATDSEEEAEEDEIQEENKELAEAHKYSLQEKLEKAGFDNRMIRDHRKLGFFYDPINHEIINHLVVTDTGELINEETAITLIKHHLRIAKSPIQSYSSLPTLDALIELLADEAIAEARQAKPQTTKHTRRHSI